MLFRILQDDIVSFLYTNYRGEKTLRSVKVICIEYYDQSEWHPEEKWFLRCFDFEKEADRCFTFSGIDADSIVWTSRVK